MLSIWTQWLVRFKIYLIFSICIGPPIFEVCDVTFSFSVYGKNSIHKSTSIVDNKMNLDMFGPFWFNNFIKTQKLSLEKKNF